MLALQSPPLSEISALFSLFLLFLVCTISIIKQVYNIMVKAQGTGSIKFFVINSFYHRAP